MYKNPNVQEVFFKTLREGILKIPDVPLLNSSPKKLSPQKSEKEALFGTFLNQRLKRDAEAAAAEELKNAEKPQEATTTVENFDARLRETFNSTFQGISKQVRIPKKKYIPDVLYQSIMNLKIQDKSLKFKGFVAIFDVNSKDFPIFDVKILQTICANYGFNIAAHKVLPFDKIKGMLFQKECLLRNDKIAKYDYESLFVNLEGLKMDEIVDGHKSTTRELRELQNKSSVGWTAKSALTYKNFTKSSPKKSFIDPSRFQVLESALVLCLIPRTSNQSHETFKKMLEEKSNLFSDSLSLFYASKERVEAFTDVQIFFPELFQVNFLTLIEIPSKTTQKNLDVLSNLEDMLNMNSFRIVKHFDAILPRDTLIKCFQNIFTNPNQLAEFLLTEPRVKMHMTGKIGNLFLSDFGISAENYVKITDQNMNYSLYEHLFPEAYKLDRVVVVLRPFMVKSGMGEVFLNIFRLNKFTIVKRINLVLTIEQAQYLAKFEEIDPSSENEYISLMRDGQCEILLMSNYTATEKALVIVDGSNNEWTTSDQIFDMNINDDDPGASNNGANLLFKSIRDGISLAKNLNVSKSSFQAKIADERIELQEKTKLMKALLASSFNFSAFCSKDKETTEELISIFLPDCGLVSDVFVIVKPPYVRHGAQILALLERLGYKIIDRKLERPSREQLGTFLSTIEDGRSEEKFNSYADVVDEWMEGEILLLHLTKVAGKKEMVALLRNFFLSAQNKPTFPLTKENLYYVLVPCWNRESVDFVYSNFYKTTRIFNAQIFKNSTPEEKKEIIRYILETTLGDSLKQVEANYIYEELPQFDPYHVNIKATSSTYGDYQIRIRDFNTKNPKYFNIIKEDYDCINLYYAYVSKSYGQKCPGFYQYRIVPEEEGIPPHHIFDCQEYMGDFFLKVIAEDIIAYKQKQKLDRSVMYNSELFKTKRGSGLAFMYGARLATYVKKLEEVTCTDIMGCGQVRITNGKPKGAWKLENVAILEYKKYSEILGKVSRLWPEMTNDTFNELHATLETIIKSETYKHSRKSENLRLFPEFIHPQSLRVFVKPDNRDMPFVHSSYKTIKYDFEKSTYTREKIENYNKDYALIYATPQITGKYNLIANILYLLKYEFGLLDRKIEYINSSSDEYDMLIQGMLEGVNRHYMIDLSDEAFLEDLKEEEKTKTAPHMIANIVDLIQMELFFVLLEAIDHKMELLNEIKVLMSRESDFLRQTIRETRNFSAAQNEELVRAQQTKIQRLQQEENKLFEHINLLYKQVARHEVLTTVEEMDMARGNKIKIARDRYFKPLESQRIETNLFKEKYKKNVTNYVDIMQTKYRNAEFFKNVDATQEKWLRPTDLYIYDIKSFNGKRVADLYVDPIVVPGEEAEKELIRSEIAKTTYFKTIKK